MALSDSQNRRDTVLATIANGASISGVVDFAGMVLAGVIMPAVWTAANLGFSVSVDGTNFFPLKSAVADGEILLTVTQGNAYLMGSSATVQSGAHPMNLAGFRYWKVRSGTIATPVNQGQQSIVTLCVTPAN